MEKKRSPPSSWKHQQHLTIALLFFFFDTEGKALGKGWWERWHHSKKPNRILKDLIRDWLAKLGL
jgi:hypothetical protein